MSGGADAKRATGFGRTFWWTLGLGLVALVVYSALTARGGVPDPTEQAHLSRGAAVLDSGLLVFREGLEAVLVLAAISASLLGANRMRQRPIAAGAGVAIAASVLTWFAAARIIGALGGPGLDLQAATGLVAVGVLLIVMNWFFHRVYWTGWIAHHHRRRRSLIDRRGAWVALGFALLGFTAVYREGFEVVLFLQNLRLAQGDAVVLEGVALGLALTAVVGVLTFFAHRHLPYRRMLVLTGALIGFVLVVMVGESAQELQLAGWLPTTQLGFTLPGWMGTWLALFPTVETIAAQAIAVIAVVGSYLAAEHIRVRRPARQGRATAQRPDAPPVLVGE
jgi:high-affinity iron transporter